MAESIRRVRIPNSPFPDRQRVREGEAEILRRVKGLKLPASLRRTMNRSDRNSMAFDYCIGGLRALHMIATSSQVPIGIRLEAALKLADAGMVLSRGARGRIKEKVGPHEPPGLDGDENVDELIPGDLELPAGVSAPSAPAEPEEDVPVGWGEEPESEAGETGKQRIVGVQPAESPSPPSQKKRLGRPRLLLSNRILRQVSSHGPLTMAQLKHRLQGPGLLLPKEFVETLETLCDKGHLERLQRAKTGITYYGTPDQIRLARDHGSV